MTSLSVEDNNLVDHDLLNFPIYCYFFQTKCSYHIYFTQDLIIDNSLTAQEKLNIGKLDKLKSLIIRWNQIPELDDDVFSKGLSNLETIKILKNNIKKLGNNVFSQLNNLKILVLQDNQLGSIKRSMLPTTADRLTSLRLE